MSTLIYDPDKIYLLIDNEYLEQDRYECDGTIIIKLSEYSEWCTNSYPKIHKASVYVEALKEYQRTKLHEEPKCQP